LNYCPAILLYLALPGVFLLAACSTESEAPAVDTGAPEFVGSTICADCHETEHRDWSGSHHELAMQVADASTVLGDFADT